MVDGQQPSGCLRKRLGYSEIGYREVKEVSETLHKTKAKKGGEQGK